MLRLRLWGVRTRCSEAPHDFEKSDPEGPVPFPDVGGRNEPDREPDAAQSALGLWKNRLCRTDGDLQMGHHACSSGNREVAGDSKCSPHLRYGLEIPTGPKRAYWMRPSTAERIFSRNTEGSFRHASSSGRKSS